MPAFDKRVDAYIARSKEFAQPILEHLRELVHKACPYVEETIKWGFPHFEYQGLLCSMAAFKQHCIFGFWKGSVMDDPHNLISIVGKTTMGNFNRITSPDDLPSDKILISYIKQAIQLNEQDVKIPVRQKKGPAKRAKAPAYFTAALSMNQKALSFYKSLSNAQKNEYIEWLTEAKTELTRKKRIATAVEWIAEGKTRNWKYLTKK